jgi:hypothetical protein
MESADAYSVSINDNGAATTNLGTGFGSTNIGNAAGGTSITGTNWSVNDATGDLATSGTVTSGSTLTSSADRVMSVTTASITSNATTLDNMHEFYIIPSNVASVAITGPATVTGKVIFIENASGFATTGIAIIPSTSPVTVWQLIWDGTQWVHAN